LSSLVIGTTGGVASNPGSSASSHFFDQEREIVGQGHSGESSVADLPLVVNPAVEKGRTGFVDRIARDASNQLPADPAK
jgi:hypothetical protein